MIYANRSNAILVEKNIQYSAGDVVYFIDEDKSSINRPIRLEYEIIEPTTFSSDKCIKGKIPKLLQGKIRKLSRAIKFEYAKLKLARIDGEQPKEHSLGEEITYFSSGWQISSGMKALGENGIVDEKFWPYRNEKIWNSAVKEIPQELIKLGKDQSLSTINRDNGVGYLSNILQIQTISEAIHAIENIYQL